MKKIKLSKERKIIIGIGVILLLLGGVYRFGPMVNSFGDGRTDIELKKQKIVKYLQRIQKGNALEDQRRTLHRDLEELQQGLLIGQTSALSAVSVQNIINEIAGKIGVDVDSTRVLRAVKIDKSEYISIPVQVSLELTMPQLKQMLYMIESYNTHLRVTYLQLRKKSDHIPVRLQASITIEGIMRMETKG